MASQGTTSFIATENARRVLGGLPGRFVIRAGAKMHEQGTTSVCPVEVRVAYPVVCCPFRSWVAGLRFSDRPRSEYPFRDFVEELRTDADWRRSIG